ncbi:hypothetical protein PK98_15490 [Croceibacterium mercuriale]|uniref:Uncharacterized protein n=1 Tax=Croceibacterium mercuriale TaxID=1572751 RepID=A0A0B2BX01_9SPHN|nr:hypothetical protein [Croceibacterium mercuriale]KHL24163.1 hypothetical protein PK98_15490 [Croceibacterium mercuriale]
MIVALLLSQAAIAAAPTFTLPELPDAVLAEQRGGVRLPSGIDLALTVNTQTAVNGNVVLQTVFSIVDGAPTVTVLTPEDGRTVAAPVAGAGTATVGGAAPVVTYDRQHGLQVTGANSAIPVQFGKGTAASSAPLQGLQAIDPTRPVRTDAGTVSQTGETAVRSVDLVAPDLTISHLVGNAFGSAIANARNDATIDTQTTLSIDLRNAGPDVLGSAMLRVEGVALDALGSRM